MPYYIDFMLDSTAGTPVPIQRAKTDTLIEIRRWPEPPNSGAMPLKMRVGFRKSEFQGQFQTGSGMSAPSYVGSWVYFNSTDGTVSGKPVQEVRIKLKNNPPNPHPANGYYYKVEMRETATGPWKTLDPRVVPK